MSDHDQLPKEPVSASEPELPMQDWFFTFGSGHAHPNGYVILHGTFAGARDQMIDLFGLHWCMQYDSAEAAGVEKYNLYRVEVL